ncbi:MAG: hypothetical protein NTW95_01295 [Candidatus Aminicenantes bacterium]|nr:hypothetical protein [Candidatus Aminicenantes bacterium]
MVNTKKVSGILFIFLINCLIFSQQNNQNQECLNAANEYKNSVFILLDPGHGCESSNGLACLPGGQPGAVDDPNNVTYSEACMTTDLALRLRDISNILLEKLKKLEIKYVKQKRIKGITSNLISSLFISMVILILM